MAVVMSSLGRTRNHKPAAAGIGLANDRKTRRGVFRTLDDYVLKQLGEAGVDGSLVSGIDVEVVGHSAFLIHVAVRADEHRTGRIAEAGTIRVKLLERGQPGAQTGEFVFARPDLSGAPLMLDPSARQLGFAGRSSDAGGIERLLRAFHSIERGRSLGVYALGLNAHVVELDVEFGQRLGDALARCACML